MVVHYADHDETVEPGDAFHMPPGHVPEADTGTRFVLFSPTADLAATEEAIKASLEATPQG